MQNISDVSRLTEFQLKVFKAVLKIPFGERRSYKWIAEQIGDPKAVRAVGQALRRNPFPLIIPCHRVIKSDGSLGGYAGSHSDRKAILLDIEQELKKRMNG